jgi:hypothetical protein
MAMVGIPGRIGPLHPILATLIAGVLAIVLALSTARLMDIQRDGVRKTMLTFRYRLAA